MQRGEIWTLRDRGYASKARPVIIVQDETVASFDSIVLCLLTSFDSKDVSTRVAIEPNDENGLDKLSYAMTDKIVTVDKQMLGERIGRLDDETLGAISEQLVRILGLSGAFPVQ